MDVLFPLLAFVFLVLFLVNRHKANKARAQFLAEAKVAAVAQSALVVEIERLKAANLTAVDEKAALAKEVVALAEENLALAAFKGILDAKREADRILLEAKNEADEAQRNATQLRNRTEAEIRILLVNTKNQSEADVGRAQEEAMRIRAQAKVLSLEASRKVESIMASAHREAKAIIDIATKRGEEIAGSAFEVVQDAERFERVTHHLVIEVGTVAEVPITVVGPRPLRPGSCGGLCVRRSLGRTRALR
jgi:hypothetical protein